MAEKLPEIAGVKDDGSQAGLTFKLKIEGGTAGDDRALEERLVKLHPGHLLALASRYAISVAMAGGLFKVSVNRTILMALLRGSPVPA
ncbi:hypothetical protein HZA43_02655 [Candidatus Peregrinibacteria bacterium]|nr:hypothetical protein [Candidatus Peregrinibacteria bacterium]